MPRRRGLCRLGFPSLFLPLATCYLLLSMTAHEKVALLAPDLTTTFPRSPRETLGSYVVAARALDKCRAELAGTQGEYHFDCPLDQIFFTFAGITGAQFKEFVATGATDNEVAVWLSQQPQARETAEIVVWNNKMRCNRLCDVSVELQMFLESYIRTFIRKNRPVYVLFDVYDIEEERI